MSNVVRFARTEETSPSGGTPHQVSGFAAPDVSRLIGTAINAQGIARRGVIIALFDLELVVINCRKAIALIPESESAERRRLNDQLYVVEQALAGARSVALSL